MNTSSKTKQFSRFESKISQRHEYGLFGRHDVKKPSIKQSVKHIELRYWCHWFIMTMVQIHQSLQKESGRSTHSAIPSGRGVFEQSGRKLLCDRGLVRNDRNPPAADQSGNTTKPHGWRQVSSHWATKQSVTQYGESYITPSRLGGLRHAVLLPWT